MVTVVTTRSNNASYRDKLSLSQLKPYREILKFIYDNPEFKMACQYETGETILKTLSYLEVLRIKSEDIIKNTVYSFPGKSYPIEDKEIDIKYYTRQFILDNIASVLKLSKLPQEFQPSRESIESLAMLSLKSCKLA